MKRSAAVFYQMCLYLALFLCGVIFFRSVMLLEDVVPRHQAAIGHMICGMMVPTAFVLLAAVLVLFYHCCGKWLQKRSSSIVLIVVLVLAQAGFLIFVSCPLYTTDTWRIQMEAIAMLKDQDGILNMEASYFQRYPNNYFIVLCFYYLFSLLSRIGMTDFRLAAIVFNTVCMDVGVLFAYLAALKLWDRKMANLVLVLCICCPTNYVWLTYVYTNTVSIPFVMGILYLSFKLREPFWGKRQVCCCILFGICTVIGYKLRPTTILPVIAIVICAVIKTVFSTGGGKRRLLLKGAVVTVTCLLVAFGVTFMIDRHVPDRNEKQGFPITHWLMMGLNETSSGGISRADVSYTERFPTKAERIAAHLDEIKSRLSAMGLTGYVRLVAEKLDRVWAEGSDNAFEKATFAMDYPVLYQSVMGRDNLVFRVYTQGIRATVFFFICICILYQILQSRKRNISAQFGLQYVIPCSPDDGGHVFVYILTLLGCIAFFILWEANCKYNICFMHVCMLLMADGIQVSEKELSYAIKQCGTRWGLSRKCLAVPAMLSGLWCLVVLCTGLHDCAVKGCNIRYVYRAESRNREDAGKELLKKATCISQTLQEGQDCGKNRWNTLRLLFDVESKAKGNDKYHAALYAMPSGTILHEADISQKDLDEKGGYCITGNMEGKAGDSSYILELRHSGCSCSMYPCLQKSSYLDMYPYGSLTIDGKDCDLDMCFELYYDLLAEKEYQ